MSIEVLKTNGKPNGKFRAVVRYKGQKEWGKTQATRDEARQDEASLLLEMGAPSAATSSWTLGTLLRDLITNGGYKPSTQVSMNARLKAVPEALLRMQATDITKADLRRHLGTIERVPTRRKVQSMISAAYRHGIDRYEFEVNPVSGLKLPKVDTPEIHPPSTEDVERIIQEAARVNPHLSTFFRLSAHLGCRRSEVVALQWSDLTPAPALIIRRNLTTSPDGTIVVGDTKTGRRAHRTLSISQGIADELLAMKPAKPTGPWMFSHDGGKTPWKPEYVSLAFKRLSGGPSIHALRHYSATTLLGLGFNVVDVAHRLGDETRTVFATYAHFIPDRDRNVANALPF